MKRLLIILFILPVLAMAQTSTNYKGNSFTAKSFIKTPSLTLNGVVHTAITSSQWTTSSGNIYFNSGNVGIGESSPYYKLHVKGNIKFDIPYNTPTALEIAPISYDPVFFIRTLSTDKAIVFDETGEGYNIGIGIGSPLYKLDVNGTIRVSGDAYFDLPHVGLLRKTDLTISATQNIWYKLTGFTTKDAGGITVQGDSVQLIKKGHYLVNYTISFSGNNNEVWEAGVFKNGTLEDPSQLRYTSTADVGNMSMPVYISSDGDDWFSFKIRNTSDNDDPTIKRISVIISTIHLVP